MKSRKPRLRWLLLLGLAIALNLGAARSAKLVELLYSRGVYLLLGQALSRFTRVAPFSLAELTVVLVIAATPLVIIRWLISCWNNPSNWLRGPWKILSLAGLLYAWFVLLWGLNYHRLPLAEIARLPVQPSSVAELTELCQELLERVNQLRPSLPEDAQAVFSLTGGKWRALARAELGYREASQRLPAIGGSYGSPKGVYLSGPWSYTGISGMYFPFTGEANVNIAMPDSLLPATACHEMAHQRGFAREDEANFIAYLACTSHPDPEFQYSGLLLALIHATNALYRQDAEAYAALRERYHPGVVRDLAANREFWQRYSGPVEQISTNINDSYLKSQGQADGVKSYGRMVDLLLAERRQRQ
jgi:hypothetical protein